eukprot:SAG11_NODE_2664_length_3116_cov_4.935366_3_plen_206_part_00
MMQPGPALEPESTPPARWTESESGDTGGELTWDPAAGGLTMEVRSVMASLVVQLRDKVSAGQALQNVKRRAPELRLKPEPRALPLCRLSPLRSLSPCASFPAAPAPPLAPPPLRQRQAERRRAGRVVRGRSSLGSGVRGEATVALADVIGGGGAPLELALALGPHVFQSANKYRCPPPPPRATARVQECLYPRRCGSARLELLLA